MLDCLDNYIGVKGCGEEPGSGQYINSLPGISLENIDMIADGEQISYAGVWADVVSEAKPRFKTDVRSELSKCYQLSKDCNYEEIICDNIELLVTAWKYLLGNQLMLERINSPRLNRYTTVDIEQARELKDHYQVEYEKELRKVAPLMNVDACELCCGGGNPGRVTWLP